MSKFSKLAFNKYYLVTFLILNSQNLIAASAYFTVPNLEQKLENKKIILIASDIEVAKITGASVRDTSANGTILAEQNVQHAIEEFFSHAAFNYMAQVAFTNQKLVRLVALQRIVEKSILSNSQSPLPSKNNFNWSLGSDSALLKNVVNADYGLFVFIRAGFKVNDKVAYQTALISLVELNTGKTVWFNAQTNLPGDLRDPGKSLDTLSTLFHRFPGLD